MNREPIYAALAAMLTTLTAGEAPAFRLVTRRLDTWENTGPESQPAVLIQQRRELANYRKGLPTIWTLEVVLFVYVHSGADTDKTLIPSQILNPLLDLIVEAFPVDDPSNNACTLGGLVSHCAVSGAVEIFQGNLGDEEVAIVPLSILVSP